MKNIGIITLSSNSNFGNKLQNYAIIEFLKKYNICANTIWIENSFISNPIKQILKMLRRIIYDYFFEYKRHIKFIKFNKLLNLKERIIFNKDMNLLNNKYSIIFVGSDQVWNPEYFNNDSIYLLKDFVGKKVSFSASFGVENLPDNRKNNYGTLLNDFDFISVREDKGKELVEFLTGRTDSEVLIDPTMLLSSCDWDKVVRKPEMLKYKRYILNYFLGDLSESRMQEIERIASENNCEIINILDKKSPFYECGPSEFLYLEKNAFLICTDSFHSSVFSILFNRPFIIFDREQKNMGSMNSRLETLINKFKLKNRKFEGKITKENLEHDYSEAYKILEEERKKSEAFLKKVLDIK